MSQAAIASSHWKSRSVCLVCSFGKVSFLSWNVFFLGCPLLILISKCLPRQKVTVQKSAELLYLEEQIESFVGFCLLIVRTLRRY